VFIEINKKRCCIFRSNVFIYSGVAAYLGKNTVLADGYEMGDYLTVMGDFRRARESSFIGGSRDDNLNGHYMPEICISLL
jgi:hypothetical protein